MSHFVTPEVITASKQSLRLQMAPDLNSVTDHVAILIFIQNAVKRCPVNMSLMGMKDLRK